MSTAKRITRHYARLVYWYDGLVEAAACYRSEKATGFEWTEEERKRLHEAARLVHQAKDIVTELYSKRIGEATTYDVRNDLWEGRSN